MAASSQEHVEERERHAGNTSFKTVSHAPTQEGKQTGIRRTTPHFLYFLQLVGRGYHNSVVQCLYRHICIYIKNQIKTKYVDTK